MITTLLNKIRQRSALIPVMLLAAALIPYGNIFSNSFVGDDPDFIVKWEQIKPPANIQALLQGNVPQAHIGTYRPLRSLYYALAQLTFGETLFYYHVLALAIHATSTLLVFLLAKRLTDNKPIALATGLLFATHPIHTEAITFITTSFDIVGIIWAMLSLYLYTKPKYSLISYILSLLCFALAIFSYEVALCIPLILLLYHWLLDRNRLSFISKTVTLIPFFYFILLYFIIRVNYLHIPTRGGYVGNSFATSAYLTIKQLPIYIFEVFFPFHTSLDHFIPPNVYSYNLPRYLAPLLQPLNLTDLYFIVSALVLAALLVAIFTFRKRHPIVSFSLSFLAVSLLPVLNIFPGFLIMFEKYLYLGSFASCLLLGYLSSLIPNRKVGTLPIQTGILACVLIFFVIKTFVRNFDWRTDISLWEQTVRQSPHNAMVWYQLGSAYQQKEQYDMALPAYMRAISLNSDMYFVHTNIGICYYYLRDVQAALPYLEKATAQFDKAKEAHYFLGKIYMDYQDHAAAINYFKTALQIDPAYAEAKKSLLDAYNRLGNFLAGHGNYSEAINAYKEAVAIDSTYSAAHENLTKVQELLQP